MGPFQEVHAPLSTAPLAVMLTVTVSSALTDPHIEMAALVEPV